MAPMSPGAWLQLLEARLNARNQRIRLYEAYYAGEHKLAFATDKFREAFGNLFAAFADNWCELVVDASVERLKVQGFRFGDQREADTEAWAIWQANSLDAESDMVHTEAVKNGEAYWLVAPPESSGDAPVITGEHPGQVIVATAPGSRRRRLAALKKWIDTDGYAYATLYLPDTIRKWRSAEKHRGGRRIQWKQRPGDPGGANPLGVVPVIPIPNKPSMLGGGRSDLAGVIPVQDAVNKLCSDLLIDSEYQAFPQRVLIGVEVTKDAQGRPLPDHELQAARSRLWVFPNKQDPANKGARNEVKVEEFSASDPSNLVRAIEMFVQHMAAQTRTPPHYLLGQSGNFPSGESLKATETGLVAKCKDKHVDFGEGHEEAMRVAFLAQGDEQRAGAIDAETIWTDPESRSFGELVDGLVKLKDIGVPQEILWERAGFSPTEITRMKSMQTADDLLNPPPPPPAAAPVV